MAGAGRTQSREERWRALAAAYLPGAAMEDGVKGRRALLCLEALDALHRGDDAALEATSRAADCDAPELARLIEVLRSPAEMLDANDERLNAKRLNEGDYFRLPWPDLIRFVTAWREQRRQVLPSKNLRDILKSGDAPLMLAPIIDCRRALMPSKVNTGPMERWCPRSVVLWQTLRDLLRWELVQGHSALAPSPTEFPVQDWLELHRPDEARLHRICRDHEDLLGIIDPEYQWQVTHAPPELARRYMRMFLDAIIDNVSHGRWHAALVVVELARDLAYSCAKRSEDGPWEWLCRHLGALRPTLALHSDDLDDRLESLCALWEQSKGWPPAERVTVARRLIEPLAPGSHPPATLQRPCAEALGLLIEESTSLQQALTLVADHGDLLTRDILTSVVPKKLPTPQQAHVLGLLASSIGDVKGALEAALALSSREGEHEVVLALLRNVVDQDCSWTGAVTRRLVERIGGSPSLGGASPFSLLDLLISVGEAQGKASRLRWIRSFHCPLKAAATTSPAAPRERAAAAVAGLLAKEPDALDRSFRGLARDLMRSRDQDSVNRTVLLVVPWLMGLASCFNLRQAVAPWCDRLMGLVERSKRRERLAWFDPLADTHPAFVTGAGLMVTTYRERLCNDVTVPLAEGLSLYMQGQESRGLRLIGTARRQIQGRPELIARLRSLYPHIIHSPIW